MSVIRFDEAGLQAASGLKRALLPARRVLVRILRPMLVQMADALESLSTRLDSVERRLDTVEGRLDVMEGRGDRQNDLLQATIGFGWDHVATTRRLAALEDQVAKCLATQALMRDAEGQLTLAFPEPVATERTALAS